MRGLSEESEMSKYFVNLIVNRQTIEREDINELEQLVSIGKESQYKLELLKWLTIMESYGRRTLNEQFSRLDFIVQPIVIRNDCRMSG